jgi:hypothetical protein
MQPWEQYSTMDLRRGNQPHHPPVTVCKPEDLPILYNAPLSVTEENKANVLDMCTYLPNEHHDFYRFLPTDDSRFHYYENLVIHNTHYFVLPAYIHIVFTGLYFL